MGLGTDDGDEYFCSLKVHRLTGPAQPIGQVGHLPYHFFQLEIITFIFCVIN